MSEQYPYEATGWISDPNGSLTDDDQQKGRDVSVIRARTTSGAIAAANDLLRNFPGLDITLYQAESDITIRASMNDFEDDGDGALHDAIEAVSNLHDACTEAMDRLQKVIDVRSMLRSNEKQRIAKAVFAELRGETDVLKSNRWEAGPDYGAFVDMLDRLADEVVS